MGASVRELGRICSIISGIIFGKIIHYYIIVLLCDLRGNNETHSIIALAFAESIITELCCKLVTIPAVSEKSNRATSPHQLKNLHIYSLKMVRIVHKETMRILDWEAWVTECKTTLRISW